MASDVGRRAGDGGKPVRADVDVGWLIVCAVVVLGSVALLYGAIGYVVLHFVAKWW